MTGVQTCALPILNAAGTYSVTITNTLGCFNTISSTISISAVPIVAPTATPSNICTGGTSQLNANASTSGSGGTAPTYCVVTNAGSSCVTSVIINTLNSTPPVCASPFYHINAPTGANTTALVSGLSYTISLVTNGTSIISVFIDYNHNGLYEATEWVQPWINAASGSATINVPANAVTGATGLRVRSRLTGNANGSGDACLAMGSGSTEDYTVTIVPPFTYSWSPAGSLSSATIYNPDRKSVV